MRTPRAVIFVCVLTLVAGARVVAAQGLDCKKPIQTAQKAIDKVTDDLKDMDKKMPKNQLQDVHALLDDAKSNLDGAHQSCDTQSPSATDQARAIGKAEAARGYAVAADKLHFHFMKETKGMQGMGSGKSMSGMKEPGGDMKGTSGMK
jgi:hypothetical protein